MLRECHRVLKRGGRFVGYVIHTADDLSPAEQSRAAELGPPAVRGPAPPDELARSVGMSLVAYEDVTDNFRVTAEAVLRARKDLEQQLRAEQGDEVYEEEWGREDEMLTGIREGLLRRCLIVADV